jgi:hypothetical protein
MTGDIMGGSNGEKAIPRGAWDSTLNSTHSMQWLQQLKNHHMYYGVASSSTSLSDNMQLFHHH